MLGASGVSANLLQLPPLLSAASQERSHIAEGHQLHTRSLKELRAESPGHEEQGASSSPSRGRHPCLSALWKAKSSVVAAGSLVVFS